MLTKQKFWINDMEAITCIMFILIVIGTINICSASLITAYTNFENPYFFLIRHLISLLIGFVAFALTSRFNYKKLKNNIKRLCLHLYTKLAAAQSPPGGC